ncbi:hypothetical protein WR25_01190 [Diploscapter pachys]|uniref:Uncharacterized protein n=1 Tax=Diploscapter pachys TaxID=2018661 RepID=A0A2A2K1R9_9BILA|nr:hypothetical protein WR25_01190 [Diploscapter pachys]
MKKEHENSKTVLKFAILSIFSKNHEIVIISAHHDMASAQPTIRILYSDLDLAVYRRLASLTAAVDDAKDDDEMSRRYVEQLNQIGISPSMRWHCISGSNFSASIVAGPDSVAHFCAQGGNHKTAVLIFGSPTRKSA